MFWTSHLCRICGQIGEMVFPIFDKEMGAENISIKIKKCLNIDVTKEDLKPKEICNNCLIKINDLLDFIQICTITNTKFEELLLSYQTQQTHTYISSYQKWLQVDGLEKSGVIIASKADTADDCTDIMFEHYKDNILDNSENSAITDNVMLNLVSYNVNSDEKHFVLKSSCLQHESQSVLRHSGDAHKVLESVYPVESLSFNLNVEKTMNDCRESFYNGSEKHLNEYANLTSLNLTDYGSSLQNVGFGNNSAIYHAETSHNVNKTQSNLPESENEPHSTKDKTKPRCSVSVESLQKPFTIISDIPLVKPHRKPPKPKNAPRKYTCADCGKSFARKLTLRTHTAVHTNVRPFVCETCDKSFAVRWELNHHRQLHTDAHRCKFCAKSFTAASKLGRHERTHTNDRPYACRVEGCGKAFSDKGNLVGHELTHSDLRNFKCEECGKAYKTRSQLKEHQLIHEEGKAHKCTVCSCSYKWPNNLRIHMKKHTGYKCTVCKVNCGKLSVLVKHRKECKNKISE